MRTITHSMITSRWLFLTRFALMAAFCAVGSVNTTAQVALPRLVSDGMVLQRNAETRIWGWASPGESVSVRFQDRAATATAGSDGRWNVPLADLAPGGPFTMDITASNRIRLSDIYVGDVWVASGQSNMELPMHRVRPLYQAEIDASDEPRIRFFDVPQRYDFHAPRQDLDGGAWRPANPEYARHFSAVAYFFAKEMLAANGVPVGILHASLGGSPAEAWMSEEALAAFPNHLDEAKLWRDGNLIRETETADRVRINAWYDESLNRDSGYRTSPSWAHPDTDVSGWDKMPVPGYWKDSELGGVNGVVWFRKDVDLPADVAGRKAFLELGRIVDSDSVFLNGRFVGNVTYQYPPRWYDVPEGVLKAGRNTIVVRVTNEGGAGGFIPDRKYELRVEDKVIDLRGEWSYRLGTRMDPLRGQTFIRWKPMGLFNAMISPLTPYTITGAIWYQGESNAGRPEEYQRLFPALIADWRTHWNQGDFPFAFVQLANFMDTSQTPTESGWARLRDAQFRTLSVPNTAMAVAIDIGEWNDIHPLNKRDVGRRLALAARRIAHGETAIVTSGPLYRSARLDGHRVELSFDHVGSGLVALGGELRHFAIAGSDGIFAWANAHIDGDKVVVWHPDIPHPVTVRYAWADNPASANLYNRDGLPASPFEARIRPGD